MLSPVIQPNTLEHANALNSLGLSTELLAEVGTRILAAYLQATPNDASSAAGSYAYFAAVRALRDVLSLHGWEPYKKQNLEMVAPPSGEIAVLPSSGDKFTGFDGIDPKTKNQKGSQTKELVSFNRNQGFLFPEMEPKSLPSEDSDAVPTWVLLYHVDTTRAEMRMELALPVHIDTETSRVDQWKTRIALASVKFDHRPTLPIPQIGAEFEFEIRRKDNA